MHHCPKQNLIKGGFVTAVEPDSLAHREGIEPGDLITEVNEQPALDILDLMWAMNDDFFELTVVRGGEEYIVEFEPQEGDVLGLSFKEDLFDGVRKCPNNCVFCFVDQQPGGLRPTLNIKDEDYRMSFLHGSFITLTNIRDKDKARIREMHLSPLYVSVHATDEAVRARLLGRKSLPPLLPLMEEMADWGIRFWTQVVVIPGWNDGEVLDDTLKTLHEMDMVNGIAVVPVGLTRHRMNLPDLKPVDKTTATECIRIIDSYREKALSQGERPLVFAADELILRADLPLPETDYYEDFLLTENGVGLLRQFLDSIKEASIPELPDTLPKSLIITGEDTEDFFNNLVMPQLPDTFKNTTRIASVKNSFLGDKVTVTGLLSGQDIRKALTNMSESVNWADQILICDCCLDDELRFIDDLTVSDISAAAEKPVVPVEDDGQAFIEALMGND